MPFLHLIRADRLQNWLFNPFIESWCKHVGVALRIYPLIIMKRGQNTGAVSSAIYHYKKVKQITFTNDSQANREAVSNVIRLQTILDFAAMRLGLAEGEGEVLDALLGTKLHEGVGDFS